MNVDLFDRSSWDLDPAVLHLNHGSFGAVPRVARTVQDRWRDTVEANPTRFFSRDLARHMDTVRSRVAAFVRADPERLVLQPNVTWAIACALGSIELGPGDEVVISDDAYPAVRHAAGAACERAGARVVTAALGDSLEGGGYIADALRDRVSARTRLVVADHITSATARRIDVAALVRWCRERGVPVLVDGAHAPGMLDLDVDAVGADFYAGALHKWCCAPRGAAFLVVSATWRDRLRPLLRGSRDDEAFPARLEWWGTDDYTAILTAPAALDLLETSGIAELRRRNAALADSAARLVSDAMQQPPPPSDGLSMVAVPLPSRLARDRVSAESLRRRIETEARAMVVITPARGRAVLRLSAAAYNTGSDYERLAVYLAAW